MAVPLSPSPEQGSCNGRALSASTPACLGPYPLWSRNVGDHCQRQQIPSCPPTHTHCAPEQALLCPRPFTPSLTHFCSQGAHIHILCTHRKTLIQRPLVALISPLRASILPPGPDQGCTVPTLSGHLIGMGTEDLPSWGRGHPWRHPGIADHSILVCWPGGWASRTKAGNFRVC